MDSKHIKDSELACKHCGGYVDNIGLKILLEHIREHFDAPITINSGTRCLTHHRAIYEKLGQTAPMHSWHLSGHAADINVKGVDPSKVYDYLNDCAYADLIGLGSYSTFTHVDTRGKRARW